ncbi:tryptophan--tRNA ligase [bacterium]|nr:tryptophan--tRNA ligase [bacterium]
MKRLITGIRPTASLTIANLIGAAFPLLELQKTDNEILVFVATMHGLTDHEPKEVVSSVDDIVKDYLALGLDPKRIIIFDQRDVRRQVALLKLYLERHITVNRACRVPTLKEKLKKGQNPEQANVLLMNYPVMMAADILLQEAEIVPVGKDQYSHMEIAKELCDSFNSKYGKNVLIRSEALNRKEPVNILALSGEGKMSKTKPETAIFLNDEASVIKKKIMKAETAVEGKDSDKIQSLLNIVKAIKPERESFMQEIINRHRKGEKVMGEFKKALAEIVIEFTNVFQEKRKNISDDDVRKILNKGAKIANKNADLVIEKVEKAMGVI